jgi:hypothetical protein
MTTHSQSAHIAAPTICSTPARTLSGGRKVMRIASAALSHLSHIRQPTDDFNRNELSTLVLNPNSAMPTRPNSGVPDRGARDLPRPALPTPIQKLCCFVAGRSELGATHERTLK